MSKMIGNRLGVFIDYLRAGNEVEVDGHTYVWLDNHVSMETETHQYIINGLALKMYPWNNQRGKVHYVGANDTSLQRLIEIVSSMDVNELVKMYDYLVERRHR